MTLERSTKGEPTAKHEPTAERASEDRMSSEHDRAPLRLLAGKPVHERGLRLGYDHWTAVVLVPSVCETLGEEWPAWAWDLCRHASAVCQAVPTTLLDALLGVGGDQAGGLSDDDAALGVELDLCVMSPHAGAGNEARILVTPFGHAVALLHRMHRDAQAAAAEDDDPQEGEGA